MAEMPLERQTPPHVAVWSQFERHSRFWRRMAVVAFIWGCLALAGAAWALHQALYEPVAFYVEPSGEAGYLGRVRARSGPTEVEARYVAKAFLKRLLSFNSLTVRSDWAEAINMMTAEAQTAQYQEWNAFGARQGKTPFVAIEQQGIQTDLIFNDPKTEVFDHNGRSFTVRLRGEIRTWPLNRVGDDTAIMSKQFESMVTLVTCPRTEKTPNGLLVAKVATRTWVPGTEAEPPVVPVPPPVAPEEAAP